MKFIAIHPVGNLGFEHNQDMHMFLTHLVHSNETYREFAKSCTGYKILDNSLIELGEAAGLGSVLEAAEIIGADEIILPDVFQKGPETIKAVKDALIEIDRRYLGTAPFKLMAVAQGRNEKEWAECYEALSGLRDISVIGIPKVLAKMHPKGRPHFEKYWDSPARSKEIHLLGIWYSTTELGEYIHPNCIRSVDSVILAYLAQQGMHEDGVRPDGFTIDLVKDTVDYNKLKGATKWNCRPCIGHRNGGHEYDF